MSKILTRLHEVQRKINFLDGLISQYNEFISSNGMSDEWIEFFAKKKDSQPINLDDIGPVVDAMNEERAELEKVLKVQEAKLMLASSLIEQAQGTVDWWKADVRPASTPRMPLSLAQAILRDYKFLGGK